MIACRDEDGLQDSRGTHVVDVISSLKAARFLQAPTLYFEAIATLEAIDVSRGFDDWMSWWTPLIRLAVAMVCGVERWLRSPGTFVSVMSMPLSTCPFLLCVFILLITFDISNVAITSSIHYSAGHTRSPAYHPA